MAGWFGDAITVAAARVDLKERYGKTDRTRGGGPSEHLRTADAFYERELARRLTGYLERVHARGAEVLVGDFGRAYLSDGWATQFIRGLINRYRLVFVGYAADDPPVQYLLEALSRDGERWAGLGTGIDDQGLARKRAAIDAALAGHRALLVDPIRVAAAMGGRELAATYC